MAISAEHRSKFAALHRQWCRLHMYEKFSSGTTNNIRPTNQSYVIEICNTLPRSENKVFTIRIGCNFNPQIYIRSHSYTLVLNKHLWWVYLVQLYLNTQSCIQKYWHFLKCVALYLQIQNTKENDNISFFRHVTRNKNINYMKMTFNITSKYSRH